MDLFDIDKILKGNDNENKNDNSNEAPTNNENNNDEYLDDFLLETNEHLENIENSLLLLEKSKDDLDIINDIFREFHTIKGISGFVSQSLVQKISHQTEAFLDKCRKGEVKITETYLTKTFCSIDYIKKICSNLELNNDKEFVNDVVKFLDNFQNEDENTLPENYYTPLETVNDNFFDEIESENSFSETNFVNVIDSIIDDGNEKSKENLPRINRQKHLDSSGIVKIPIQKVDALIDLVGEMLIYQSQFEDDLIKTQDFNSPLIQKLRRVALLTSDMQKISMSMRMVSLKSTFQRIERIGRDTLAELKKKAEIIISGEDTEVDRSVVETLFDPLVHLIKNSVSHGIESLSDRINNGKPSLGKIKINAYNKKGNIFVEISDDGTGINTNNILKTAIDKNIVDPFLDYSESEILNFIFLPGFSTTEKANRISGRGVGLDVVKTHINKIGGNVEVKNKPGEGCTFILKIPVNLSIINGTIVEISNQNYILPTLSISRFFVPTIEDFVSVKGNKNFLKIQDLIVPIVDVKKTMDILDFETESCIFIIIETNTNQIALPVNKIVGTRDIVIKPLGPEFNSINYALGASILGDGKISIILDVDNMIFEKEKE